MSNRIMNSNSIKHSKYKNTGILFELLVRQVTSDVMEGRENSPALQLMQKYFSPTTELGKELGLYRSFFTTNNLSETKAFKFVDIIVSQRKKLNSSKLQEEKYNLIREIKNKYDLEKFLSAKIPEYKVFASIYKTFLAETTNTNVSETEDVINARFTISEHVMGSPKSKESKDELVEEFKSQNEDLRLLSYKILVDKFNDKYKGLGDDQKKLLREYINNISNSNSLRDYIISEVPIIEKKLSSHIKNVDDPVTKIKLNEVKVQLNKVVKGNKVKDSQVTALMICYQLIKELENVEGR